MLYFRWFRARERKTKWNIKILNILCNLGVRGLAQQLIHLRRPDLIISGKSRFDHSCDLAITSRRQGPFTGIGNVLPISEKNACSGTKEKALVGL